MILLDTSALSLIFRRKTEPAENAHAAAFRRLLRKKEPLGVPGIVVQEILSGIKSPIQHTALRRDLEGLAYYLATLDDHYRAAELFNHCRSRGIAPSTVDCLVAATCIGHRALLWAQDRDFERIAQFSSLKLFTV